MQRRFLFERLLKCFDFNKILFIFHPICKWILKSWVSTSAAECPFLLLNCPIEWFDFNGMSTHLWLFYALRLRNRVYCKFMLTFLCSCFLRAFYHTVIWYEVFLSNTNNLNRVIWYQVILFNKKNAYSCIVSNILRNTNNYNVSSNYFHLIIVICSHIVLWLQQMIILNTQCGFK